MSGRTRVPLPWYVRTVGARHEVVALNGTKTPTLIASVAGNALDDDYSRLIAAAPGLLAFAQAVGGFLAWAKDNGGDNGALAGIEAMRRAAISAAGGEV